MFTRRVQLLAALFIAGLVLIAVRAFYLQVGDRERMTRLAQSEVFRDIRVPAERGDIVDRHGQVLANSISVPSVHANPMVVADAAAASRALGPILGVPERELRKKLSQRGKYFVWLKRQVTPSVADEVRRLAIKGVDLTDEFQRFYPNRQVAGQLLGFVGIDGQGLEGLERAYEERLRGKPLVVSSLRDKRGRLVFEHDPQERKEHRGAKMHLTIDAELQDMTESVLQEGLVEFGAASAIAVVLDVETADVLAMATVPSFNPNEDRRGSAAKWRNRPVTDAFEVGSTLKPITLAAAFNEGVLKRNERINAENGAFKVRGGRVTDRKPFGLVTPMEVLRDSVNIACVKIAQRMGRETFYGYLLGFGFDRLPGTGLGGETKGLLRTPERWADLDFANIAFGQGIAVSPLQLALAYRVLAAKGRYRPARLVSAWEYPSGRREEIPPKPEDRVLRPEVADLMVELMQSVVQPDGTGVLAEVPGIRVAGKTGTAEKPNLVDGGYTDKNLVSFAGMLPAEHPRAVVVVMVDEPSRGRYGGYVAAPLFSKIAGHVAQKLGVPSDPDRLKAAMWRMQHGSAAKVDMREGGGQDRRPVVEGSVPDLNGMTLREAASLLSALKGEVRLVVNGFGWVQAQQPEPGTPWAETEHLVLELGQKR